MPPMQIEVLEYADPHAPYGVRGVGEPPTISSGPGRRGGDPGGDGQGAAPRAGPARAHRRRIRRRRAGCVRMPRMFLNGTAMAGGADHHLVGDAPLVAATTTAPRYRFHAVDGPLPRRWRTWATRRRGGRGRGLRAVATSSCARCCCPVSPPGLELGVIELADGIGSLAMVLRRAARRGCRPSTSPSWRSWRRLPGAACSERRVLRAAARSSTGASGPRPSCCRGAADRRRPAGRRAGGRRPEVVLGRRRGAAAGPRRHARARQRAGPHRVGGLRDRHPRGRGRRRHHDRRHAAQLAAADRRRGGAGGQAQGRRPGSARVDVAFWGGAVPGNLGRAARRCTTPASSGSSAS